MCFFWSSCSCWCNWLVLSSFLFSFSQSQTKSVCQTDGLIVGLWRARKSEHRVFLFFSYVFCAHWIRHSTSEEFFFGSSWLKSAQERARECTSACRGRRSRNCSNNGNIMLINCAIRRLPLWSSNWQWWWSFAAVSWVSFSDCHYYYCCCWQLAIRKKIVEQNSVCCPNFLFPALDHTGTWGEVLRDACPSVVLAGWLVGTRLELLSN